MDKSLRNSLRLIVVQSRKILEEAVGELLQGQFGIHADGEIEAAASMTHLSEEEQQHREQILVHLKHIQAAGFKLKDAVAQLVREIAFTHLNRLCAYKMMETRRLIREAVSRGVKSNGFIFYLADHVEDERLWSSGKQDIAYRHFLKWLGETLSEEIGVLFSPHDSASRLFPPYHILERVLELLNSEDLKGIWAEDETIGWVYQYFTPKELRDQARKESQAPRNSYELAFRNQFYTPRYVVQFLTENTLGITWYEMRQGNTQIKERCSYLVRRPDEVFFAKADSPEVEQAQCWLQGEDVPEPDLWSLAHTVNGYGRAGEFGEKSSQWMKERLSRLTSDGAKELKTQELLDLLFLFCRYERFNEGTLGNLSREVDVIKDTLRERVRLLANKNLSQEELLRVPFFVPYRPKKDPREIRILDPACGSGHFLLYCFDLLETIYEEAYEDPELAPNLQRDYATLADLKKAVPSLILAYNLHGIDIDLRATQIAALALWLRAQRAYQIMDIKGSERPKITRSNIVCAEPMPGEKEMLEEFIKDLQPMILGNLVRAIFEKMQLASEAGSLLKIEEEIKEAILEAKQLWLLRPKGEQLALWPEQASAKPAQLSLFEGVTNKEFWEGVEARVIDALHQYAHSVSNGRSLARQLFADDVVQGFAFIDICRKRFDIILMNPPFGFGPLKVKEYIAECFPEGKNDLAAAMIQRGSSLLQNEGFLGALTTRALLNLPSLEDWRLNWILAKGQLWTLADLGYGVLDDAIVEAAAYVLNTGNEDSRLLLSCLDTMEKDVFLHNLVKNCWIGNYTQGIYIRRPTEFVRFPAAVLAYSIPSSFAQKIISWPKLELHGISAKAGLQTADDERFLRTAWEVPPSQIQSSNHWISFAKGGEWNPFWDDIHLLIDWSDSGRSIIESGGTLRNPSAYFHSGLTYPERTTSSFGPRILPANCIFSTAGQAIFFQQELDTLSYLGLLLSRPGQLLIEMSLGGGDSSTSGTAARHYTNGMLNRLPFPIIDESMKAAIAEITRQIVDIKRSLFETDELSRHFKSLTYLRQRNTLRQIAQLKKLNYLETCAALAPLVQKLETCAEAVFGITNDEEKIILSELVGPSPFSYSQSSKAHHDSTLVNASDSKIIGLLKNKIGKGARFITKNSQLIDRKLELLAHLWSISLAEIISIAREATERDGTYDVSDTVLDVISYDLGICFGRWDVRIIQDMLTIPSVFSSSFTSLSACPPGMLIGPDGLPAITDNIVSEEWLRARPDTNALPAKGSVKQPTILDEQYPLTVDWEGILTDDPNHPDDIVRHVQNVLKVIWQDHAESIEQEACQILEIKELREYFRRSGNNGFWMDHVKRYSKSRRKSPIYWLLQSAKRNYALWLYYHRLDKDTLFKALTKYVEPKLRLEDSRLEQWRVQLAAVGSEGRTAKQLERQVERQESLVAELYDFRDKLRRAADLNLEPDLNDGVVLNIAPLHELIPWSEAKKYWDELLAGKYEWSSISKQLRDKGVI